MLLRGKKLKKQNNTLYRLLRFLFAPLFRLWFRPVISGREFIPASGRAVIAGNHMHALDPILVDVCTKRVVHTLAKKELHDGPFGFLFRGVGTIPVDLHSKENRAALSAAVAMLEDDHVINVSPEAKRNYTNELLLPFKYGAVSMAQKTGSPLIPYAITGGYKPFRSRPKIVFGEPFYVGDKTLPEANKELYHRVLALLSESMDPAVLAQKHITTFDEWSQKNETTS